MAWLLLNQSILLNCSQFKFSVIPAKAGIQPRIKYGAFLTKARKSGFRVKHGMTITSKNVSELRIPYSEIFKREDYVQI
ncbi:MAG: hypothetical protein AABY78_04055 [Nitrospirota bacterium]